jgi:hypothetical protein
VGDIFERAVTGIAPNWPAHAKDVWNTLAWPVLLTLAGRWTRLLRRR